MTALPSPRPAAADRSAAPARSRDLPIIFSPPMILALLDGRKTMTRRFAWGPRFQKAIDNECDRPGWRWGVWTPGQCAWPTKAALKRIGLLHDTKMLIGYMAASAWQRVRPGDRLWVKENFRNQQTTRVHDGDGARRLVCIDYVADDTRIHWNVPEVDCPPILLKRGRGESGQQTALITSLHMPRLVSRLTSIVTATKIERLQDISEEDALAEGIHERNHSIKWPDGDPGWIDNVRARAFAQLWNALHGKDAWDANPEVVCPSFRVVKANIDALPKAEAA